MYATEQGPIRDLTSLLSVFLSINFYSNYVKKISYMRTNSISWVNWLGFLWPIYPGSSPQLY